MVVIQKKGNGEYVFKLSGMLDIEKVEELEQSILEIDDIKTLLVDLSDIEYISPAGKEFVLRLYNSERFAFKYENARYLVERELQKILKKEIDERLIGEDDEIELTWVKDSKENKDAFAAIKRMSKNYLADLSSYTNDPPTEPIKKPEDNTSVSYVLISVKKNGELIPAGYFLYSLFPNSFSKHDVFISEFYIKKRMRNKGIGRRVAEMIMSSAETKYYDISMYIYEKNTKAKKFWNINFNIRGYMDRFLCGDVVARPAFNNDLRFYYFSKT